MCCLYLITLMHPSYNWCWNRTYWYRQGSISVYQAYSCRTAIPCILPTPPPTPTHPSNLSNPSPSPHSHSTSSHSPLPPPQPQAWSLSASMPQPRPSPPHRYPTPHSTLTLLLRTHQPPPCNPPRLVPQRKSVDPPHHHPTSLLTPLIPLLPPTATQKSTLLTPPPPAWSPSASGPSPKTSALSTWSSSSSSRGSRCSWSCSHWRLFCVWRITCWRYGSTPPSWSGTAAWRHPGEADRKGDGCISVTRITDCTLCYAQQSSWRPLCHLNPPTTPSPNRSGIHTIALTHSLTTTLPHAHPPLHNQPPPPPQSQRHPHHRSLARLLRGRLRVGSPHQLRHYVLYLYPRHQLHLNDPGVRSGRSCYGRARRATIPWGVVGNANAVICGVSGARGDCVGGGAGEGGVGGGGGCAGRPVSDDVLCDQARGEQEVRVGERGGSGVVVVHALNCKAKSRSSLNCDTISTTPPSQSQGGDRRQGLHPGTPP